MAQTKTKVAVPTYAFGIGPHRARLHTLAVAIGRLEEDCASAELIKAMRDILDKEIERTASGREWREIGPAEEKRIAHQRNLFTYLTPGTHKDRLLAAMRQRIYDLMWNGDGHGADAIAEFLPSADADKAFEAWEHDWSEDPNKTEFYGHGR